MGVPRSRLRMPTWISCGPSAISRSKPAAKLSSALARQPGDQVRVDVHARLAPQEAEVVLQPLIVLAAVDQRSRLLVERLDADLELERARREPGDHLAQRLRQPVRHHLEVEEVPGLVALEEELQDGPAGVER